jgi:hypothetical protein
VVAILAFVAARAYSAIEAQPTSDRPMHRATALLAHATLLLTDTAAAQLAPTFQARCDELRAAMAGLNGREEDELITIEVVGPLAFVRAAGGIVYLGLCGPPDPRVLCVTKSMIPKSGNRFSEQIMLDRSTRPTAARSATASS